MTIKFCDKCNQNVKLPHFHHKNKGLKIMPEEKKKTPIHIKGIDKKTWYQFRAACARNMLSASYVIRKFIKEYAEKEGK